MAAGPVPQLTVLVIALFGGGLLLGARKSSADSVQNSLDLDLSDVLHRHGFTGRVGSTLEQQLGRKVDDRLADLGRDLFHDTVVGLNDDNSCAGRHSAAAGFGGTQSITIGVENNFVGGPHRAGTRDRPAVTSAPPPLEVSAADGALVSGVGESKTRLEQASPTRERTLLRTG